MSSLAAMLERNTTLVSLLLTGNSVGADGAVAFQATLQSNCTLDTLDGVDGVEHILKRNREIRIARKHKVNCALRYCFVC